jgi:hypothetical protein
MFRRFTAERDMVRVPNRTRHLLWRQDAALHVSQDA